MRAKSFFYVSLGILALALAYHFGATTATAQAPSNPIVTDGGFAGVVVTANGDVYACPDAVSRSGGSVPGYANWTRVGNVFGSATPAALKSWGQVKSDHLAPSNR